jgi:ABC-type Co2+ transport system permease subunit
LPVGLHSSTHWVGGCALAWMFGPWLAIQTMGIVLLLQALLLGDGGLNAWGVNLFNMGVVPAILTGGIVHLQGRNFFALAVAAASSILLAAMLIPCEVAIGRSSEELQSWQHFFAAILSFHTLAAVVEAVFTVAAMAAWQRLSAAEFSSERKSLAVLSWGVMLASVASLVSSNLPDGYEAAAGVAMQALLSEEILPWLSRVLQGSETLLSLISTMLVAGVVYGWMKMVSQKTVGYAKS